MHLNDNDIINKYKDQLKKPWRSKNETCYAQPEGKGEKNILYLAILKGARQVAVMLENIYLDH